MAKSLSKKCQVELYARTNDLKLNKEKIIDYYGIKNYNINLKLIYYPFPRFIELFVTLLFLYKNIFKTKQINKIISRNLLTSFILNIFFSKIDNFYETHSPERGVRSFFQKIILFKECSKTIVISNALKSILIHKYNLSSISYSRIYCFHDAAPIENSQALPDKEDFLKCTNLSKSIFNKKIIAYFGNLYKGRGENLILKLALINPNINFVLFGSKLNYQKKINNLFFIEFVPPYKVISLMKTVDMLLMPYEKKVFLSDIKNETSKWMSPLKMFEYMSAGIPFISSRIEVLQEVLIDKHNCILANTDDVDDWNNKIHLLLKDSNLSKKISKNSYNDFITKYNWDIRSQDILYIKNKNTVDVFAKYIVNNKLYSRGLKFFNKRIRIFTKSYIEKSFKFYISTIFSGINFHNKKVLDIGSGTGIYSIYASLAGASNVVSIEPESEGSHNNMVKTFINLKEKFNCHNIEIVNSTLQDYEITKNKFDIVIMHNTINHLDEDATSKLKKDKNSQKTYVQIFENLKSKLNDDANIIITDCSNSNLFGDLNIKNPMAPQIEWNKHNPPEIWKIILMKSGFKKIKIKWINHSSLRGVGLFLFGNKYASYFLNSYFLIKCKI